MWRTSIRFWIPATALFLAVSACSLVFEEPSVRIADVRVTEVGLTGATAEVTLRVVNPNGYELTARGLEYRLELQDPPASDDGEREWHTLSESRRTKEVAVPAGDSADVRIEAPFRYADLGRGLRGLLQEGEVHYRLTGRVTVDAPLGEVRVPFEETGDLAL